MKPSPGRDLADRITQHLQRWERDPQINARLPHGGTPLYLSQCVRVGSRISICYISYQGASTLTFKEAQQYLAALDLNPHRYVRHHEVLAAYKKAMRTT